MRKKYVPVQGVWEITLACNMRCRHCGSHAGVPRPDELTTAEALRVLGELAAAGCRRLVLSGGEPTVRRDWPRLVEEGTRLGIQMKMISNGWSFDAETARVARAAGLRAVGFSLDGLEKTHEYVRRIPGSFRRVLDAVRAARAEGIGVAIVSHINRRNLSELDAMFDLIKALDAYSWQIQLGNPAGELALHRDLVVEPIDLLQIVPAVARLVQRDGLRVVPADNIGYYGPYEKVLRKNSHYGQPAFAGCLGGISHFGLESNGNLKACLSLPSARHGCASYVEGNLRETPFAELWNRPGAFAFNRDSDPAELGGFCRSCRYARPCHGGCRWSATVNGGGLENPYCYYRVATEAEARRRRSRSWRLAAAVAAPLALGACGEGEGNENATSPDARQDVVPSDAYGIPLDVQEDVLPSDAYGIPLDVQEDVLPSDAYGIPLDVQEDVLPSDAYGIPLDVQEDVLPSDVQEDIVPSDAYGIPD
ncbi:MAG TPA: radical SAM protein [Polyangiaceae bacterium]|jgi:radical SAM protein with 4Fe4S-binding SPASM domain|nr:MAG: Cyclic pyranopterin monophosphate synthase [Deltaproteobacteria bacterium ADurb.Bin207]HNZ23469.1 radical SAM protein [Polyangiaceae bacterium]HOH01240.1 radical SAM protein [Polyangiaceae bacterium]